MLDEVAAEAAVLLSSASGRGTKKRAFGRGRPQSPSLSSASESSSSAPSAGGGTSSVDGEPSASPPRSRRRTGTSSSPSADGGGLSVDGDDGVDDGLSPSLLRCVALARSMLADWGVLFAAARGDPGAGQVVTVRGLSDTASTAIALQRIAREVKVVTGSG